MKYTTSNFLFTIAILILSLLTFTVVALPATLPALQELPASIDDRSIIATLQAATVTERTAVPICGTPEGDLSYACQFHQWGNSAPRPTRPPLGLLAVLLIVCLFATSAFSLPASLPAREDLSANPRDFLEDGTIVTTRNDRNAVWEPNGPPSPSGPGFPGYCNNPNVVGCWTLKPEGSAPKAEVASFGLVMAVLTAIGLGI